MEASHKAHTSTPALKRNVKEKPKTAFFTQGPFFQSKGNEEVIRLKRALNEEESKKCLEKVEKTIQKLEESAKDEERKLPDYIKKAILLLRDRKKRNKIKCYAFEGITHGTVDFEKEEIHVDGLDENWINETTLLHEGIHALHGKEYPKAAQKYEKAQKNKKKIDLDNPSKEDLELLRFKAWTEYWAYRSRFEYHNQTREKPFTDEEIHQMVSNEKDVRVHINRVRRHDKTFDPRKWTPKS